MTVKINSLYKGTSLIEIIISILVFSIGLLAIAKLQLLSIRISKEAQLQSMALSQTALVVESSYLFGVIGIEQLQNKISHILPGGELIIHSNDNPPQIEVRWNKQNADSSEKSSVHIKVSTSS